jgi:hypothetical protein
MDSEGQLDPFEKESLAGGVHGVSAAVVEGDQVPVGLELSSAAPTSSTVGRKRVSAPHRG